MCGGAAATKNWCARLSLGSGVRTGSCTVISEKSQQLPGLTLAM
jgi:hypothetical protein